MRTASAGHSEDLRHGARRTARHSLLGLLCLVFIAAGALAACAGSPGAAATPTRSNAQQAPAIHVVLDGHFASQSSGSLRATLVALDPHDGHVVWRHPLETSGTDDGSYTRFPAVTANGLVYLGYYYDSHATGHRVAVLDSLDAATGQTRWRQEIDAGQESEITGPPVVAGSAVYVSVDVTHASGQSGLVAAFDAQSGSVRWRKALADQPNMPAVANGNVFVLTTSGHDYPFTGHLLALHASDGATAWDYTADAPLTRGGDVENDYSTAPVVSGDLAYPQAIERLPNGTADIVQLAISTVDGSLAWKFETGGIAATPALNQSGDTLCLGVGIYASRSWTDQVDAINASTGQRRWSVSLPAAASGCVPSGDTFLVNAGTLAGPNGGVLALRSQDGQRVWQASTGAPVDADGALAPVVANGLAVDYLPDDAHGTASIVVLRASDGRIVWRQSFHGHPAFAPDVEGDVLYNPERQGSAPIIAAYDLSTGQRLWSYTIGNA